MTRKLFLHVGPAKTGTSAVQQVLKRHDNSVVIYPKVGLWSDGSHHNLILNYFGEYMRPEVVREDPAVLLARIGNEAKQSKRDIVISSEALAGRKDLVGFSAALECEIGEPLSVEIVVVAREHFERAASAYNQRVKDAVTAETRDPDAFLAAQAQGLVYANLLNRLEKTGFAISVLNYHPSANCVQRVLAKFGFKEPPAEYPVRNVSLNRPALVATLAANRAAGSRDERNRFSAALRRTPWFHLPAGRIFGSATAFEADRLFFAKDRDFLRQRFGIDLNPPDYSEDCPPFAVDEEEFANIRDAAARLGGFGDKIIEWLRPYVQTRQPA